MSISRVVISLVIMVLEVDQFMEKGSLFHSFFSFLVASYHPSDPRTKKKKKFNADSITSSFLHDDM